jgi:hypothetical protein
VGEVIDRIQKDNGENVVQTVAQQFNACLECARDDGHIVNVYYNKHEARRAGAPRYMSHTDYIKALAMFPNTQLTLSQFENECLKRDINMDDTLSDDAIYEALCDGDNETLYELLDSFEAPLF